MARTDLVVLGALLMFLVAPIVGVLGVLFIFFGGLLLFPLAGILGIVGLILFIVGLISPSDLEKAALARMVAPTAPPPTSPSAPPPVAPPIEPQAVAAGPGKWTPRKTVLVLLIAASIITGSTIGGIFAFQAWSQPHILVRNFDASLSSCGFFSPNQSVFVDSFHLVNTGPAAGYVDVAITVDGNVVRTYTFLVLSGEDRIFRPSDDALHSFSPSDETIRLQGCSSQLVGVVVGNVWRA